MHSADNVKNSGNSYTTNNLERRIPRAVSWWNWTGGVC